MWLILLHILKLAFQLAFLNSTEMEYHCPAIFQSCWGTSFWSTGWGSNKKFHQPHALHWPSCHRKEAKSDHFWQRLWDRRWHRYGIYYFMSWGHCDVYLWVCGLVWLFIFQLILMLFMYIMRKIKDSIICCS